MNFTRVTNEDHGEFFHSGMGTQSKHKPSFLMYGQLGFHAKMLE